MKQLRMVYLGDLKTFIIYLKTKYDKSVLSIVCRSTVWSCHMLLQIMHIKNYEITAH